MFVVNKTNITMEKTLIAHYINIGNLSGEDIKTYIDTYKAEIVECYKEKNILDVTVNHFIPVKEGLTRVEIIGKI